MKKCIFVSLLLLICTMQTVSIMGKEHCYYVILAGGSGERLWPLSRLARPKQLLEIGDKQTLLDQAIQRVSSLTIKENIWICTTAQHAQAISGLMKDKVGTIFIEPGSRNTGPAILLSCLEIYKKDPQAIITFLPADSFIPDKDTKKFCDFIAHGVDFAKHNDRITLFGVKPTFAATGYGYIEFQVGSNSPYQVKKFHEKPSLEKAQEYYVSSTMLWNICMFCAKASVFIDEFKTNALRMYNDVQNYRAGICSYDTVLSDSIDFAVLEKSNYVSVLPVDFAWCDVGNIEIFLTLKKQYTGLNDTKLIEIESKNNLIDVPNKLVALVGVDDLCVIETEQVILITKRDQAEKVKAVVKMLKQGEFKEYL